MLQSRIPLTTNANLSMGLNDCPLQVNRTPHISSVMSPDIHASMIPMRNSQNEENRTQTFTSAFDRNVFGLKHFKKVENSSEAYSNILF